MSHSKPELRSLYLIGIVVLSLLVTPGVPAAVSAGGNTEATNMAGNSVSSSSGTTVVINESAGDPNDNIVTDEDQFRTFVQAQSDESVRIVLSKNATYHADSVITTTGASAAFNLSSRSDAAGVWGVYVQTRATDPELPEANESLEEWSDAKTAVLVANTSTVRDTAADGVWQSSKIKWRESQLFLKSDTPAADAGDTWAIFELTDDGLELEQPIRLDQNAEAVVDTSELTNRYIIVSDDGRIVTFDDDTGQATGRLGSDDRSAVRAFSTEFANHSLQVGVTQDTIETRPDTLYLNSNRGTYNVTVTAADMDGQTLRRVFANATAVRQTGPESITFQVTEVDETLQLNLSSAEEGRHVFEIEATDSGAQDVVAVYHIPEEAVGAGLQNNTAVTPAGSVVRVPIRLRFADRATVHVGSREVNYLTSVNITDTDSDGVVVLRINTWLAGRSDELNERAVSIDDGRIRETTLHTEPIADPPLDSSAYELNVTVNGRQKSTSSVLIRKQSVEKPEMWTAPATSYDQLQNVGDIQRGINNGTVTRTKTVAQGDLAIIALTGPGLSGALDAKSNESVTEAAALSELETTNGNSVVHIEQRDPPPNQEPAELDLQRTAANSGLRVRTDHESGTVYLIVKTNQAVLDNDGDEQRQLHSDDELKTNLTLGPNYGVEGSEQTVTQNWEMVERQVTFDATSNRTVHVRQADCQVISGETTLAPGTELVLRAHGNENESLIRSARPVVDRTGRFDAQLNFSSVYANETLAASVVDTQHDETSIRVSDEPPAAVQFSQRPVTNDTVRADGVRLPSEGFLVVYDAETLDVLGVSSRLDAGTNADIRVNLTGNLTGTQEIVAIVHDDTNHNGEFDGATVDRPFYRDCEVAGATSNVTRHTAAGKSMADSNVSNGTANKSTRSTVGNDAAPTPAAAAPLLATDDDSVESITESTEPSVQTVPIPDLKRPTGATESGRPMITIGGTVALVLGLAVLGRRTGSR
jgi:predicted secreted protein